MESWATEGGFDCSRGAQGMAGHTLGAADQSIGHKSRMARASVESFNGVPVPCALMSCSLAGSAPALSSARRIALSGPQPEGCGCVRWWILPQSFRSQ